MYIHVLISKYGYFCVDILIRVWENKIALLLRTTYIADILRIKLIGWEWNKKGSFEEY